MYAENFVFFLFGVLTIFSAFMVVSVSNPIHSILFLVLTFCSVSGLLLTLQVEFLALIFIVVYVGAIAVLFLFVVMMLNIRVEEFNEKFLSYFPLSGYIGILFASELLGLVKGNFSLFTMRLSSDSLSWLELVNAESNIHVIGQVLYTHYFFLFEVAGVVLLVAMVSSILLTLQHRPSVKRQEVQLQVAIEANKVLKFYRLCLKIMVL